jgi:hydrogenase maturation protease
MMAGEAPNAAAHQDYDPLILDMRSRAGPEHLHPRDGTHARGGQVLTRWCAGGSTRLDLHDRFYNKPVERESGKGFGSTEGARGARRLDRAVEDGKIENYQVITPTAWNIGPRDGKGRHGPMEQAFIGATVTDPTIRSKWGTSRVRSTLPRLHRPCVRREDGQGTLAIPYRRDGMTNEVHTLIVGCGNLLRGDDAVGPILVRHLWDRGVPHGVRCADGGTGGMDVGFQMRGVPHVIIVDACRSGSEPGAIFRLDGADCETTPLAGVNLHAFRWDHAIAFARWALKDEYPARVDVWLIEAAQFDPGMPLTPAVEASMLRVADLVLAEVQTAVPAASGAGASSHE